MPDFAEPREIVSYYLDAYRTVEAVVLPSLAAVRDFVFHKYPQSPQENLATMHRMLGLQEKPWQPDGEIVVLTNFVQSPFTLVDWTLVGKDQKLIVTLMQGMEPHTSLYGARFLTCVVPRLEAALFAPRATQAWQMENGARGLNS